MSIILERVLRTTHGLRLSRKHFDKPLELWNLYKEHQTKSATSALTTANLRQELAKMKIAEFPTPKKYLDIFDAMLKIFNKLSKNPLPPFLAIGLLRTASNDNT